MIQTDKKTLRLKLNEFKTAINSVRKQMPSNTLENAKVLISRFEKLLEYDAPFGSEYKDLLNKMSTIKDAYSNLIKTQSNVQSIGK